MPIEITCQTCGVKKTLPPSLAKNRKYCSRSCVKTSGINNSNWKGGLAERSCRSCLRAFFIKKKDVKAGGGIYCSIKCKAEWVSSQPRVEKAHNRSCIFCGTGFYLKQSAIDSGQGSYCGSSCMAEHYKNRMKGEANPNHRHGNAGVTSYYASMRRSAEGFYGKEDIEFLFSSQKGKCANCLKSIKTSYHIDHIYPVSKGGSNWPSNLQLLCPACNQKKSAKDPLDWAKENGRLI